MNEVNKAQAVSTETVTLYLVEFRRTKHYTLDQLRNLNDLEIISANWIGSGEDRWAGGHDSNSLRDRRPLPVLTWDLGCGDKVLLMIKVRLEYVVTLEKIDGTDETRACFGVPTKAHYQQPTVFDERSDGLPEKFVRLWTADPHPRMLGDDSDAHEPTDALREAVQCFLDGDKRAAQVLVTLEDVPDGYDYPANTLTPSQLEQRSC